MITARNLLWTSLNLLFGTVFLLPIAQAQEVAITFDDLPAHGPLPAGTTLKI
jgi:hypothetical protein